VLLSSRLGSQVILSKDLDGIIVNVPGESARLLAGVVLLFLV
jgi:hypothetical protein